MTEKDFLKRLKKRLALLPADERQKALEYYSEMIEDGVEEGLSESDSVSRLGDINTISGQILMGYYSDQYTEHINSVPQYDSGFAVRLAITLITSPIWLPIYISVWSVFVSLFAASIGCAAGGLIYITPSVFMITAEGAAGWVQTGTCLTVIGLGILLWFAAFYLSKIWLKLSVWLCRGIRYSFRGRVE